MSDFDKVIETIEESSYHIPQEFFVDMASGIPSAYVEGITNGKKTSNRDSETISKRNT